MVLPRVHDRLGAHYLPFVTLYGMRMFYALAGVLVGAGFALALYLKLPFSAGAWFTATVLLVFAVLGRLGVSRELARPGPNAPAEQP